MRLAALAEQLAAWTDTGVHLVDAYCLHNRDRYSDCDKCSAICPAAAIEPGPPPTLDTNKCQDCRACLAVCPTGACLFTGRDAVDGVLSCIARSDLWRIELLCGYNEREAVGAPGATVGLRVRGCLAGLGVALYLNLVASGVDEVRVRVDSCMRCPWSSLSDEIVRQVSHANRLLEQWDGTGAVTLIWPDAAAQMKPRALWQAESPPRTRRQLLRAVAGEDAALNEPGDGQRFYRERLRFVRAVRALPRPEPARADSTSLAGLSFAALAIDETCTACGTCARACPTEALRLVAENGAFSLTFEPQLCLGCEACVHGCAPQSIGVDHAPSFGQVFGRDDPQVLISGNLTTCEHCGTGFATSTGSDLCPVCQFREDNPFGSTIPPGARLRRPRPGLKDSAGSAERASHDN